MNPAAPSLAKRGAPFVKARGAASTFHVCDLIKQCCAVLNGIYPVVSVPQGDRRAVPGRNGLRAV